MKTDLLASRHIGINEQDTALMLRKIGVNSLDELIDHICSRLFVLPNETVVYPGHGAPTTIGMEKAENPFFR